MKSSNGIFTIFVLVFLLLGVFFVSAQGNILLNNENPSTEVTFEGETYAVELVSATDFSATIRVTDSSGDSETKEIDEGDDKKINDLDITLVSADETNTDIEAVITISGIDGPVATNEPDEDDMDDDNDKDKAEICHFPPGNPGKAHTIEIGIPAVNAHLAHGDHEGECKGGGDDDEDDEIELEIATTIENTAGVKSEVKIKRRIRKDGTIKTELKYKQRIILSDLIIREEIKGSDLRSKRLRASLVSGNEVDIGVTPDVAVGKMLQKLKIISGCTDENKCEISLKESQESDDEKLVYELKLEIDSKVFGLFPKKMKVRAQAGAVEGVFIDADKPWWAFITSVNSQSN